MVSTEKLEINISVPGELVRKEASPFLLQVFSADGSPGVRAQMGTPTVFTWSFRPSRL